MAGSASCMSYLRGPAPRVMRREDEKFPAPGYGSQPSIGLPSATSAAGTARLWGASNATCPASRWDSSAGVDVGFLSVGSRFGLWVPIGAVQWGLTTPNDLIRPHEADPGCLRSQQHRMAPPRQSRGPFAFSSKGLSCKPAPSEPNQINSGSRNFSFCPGLWRGRPGKGLLAPAKCGAPRVSLPGKTAPSPSRSGTTKIWRKL